METFEDDLSEKSLFGIKSISPILETSEEIEQQDTGQQITNPSATDQSAFISAARGIGTVENNHTSIKQAFLFLKDLTLGVSGLDADRAAVDHPVASARTASLDEAEDTTHVHFENLERSTRKSSNGLKKKPFKRIYQSDKFEWVRCSRFSCLAILAFVLLSIATISVVSALYATHILPATSRNSNSNSSSSRGLIESSSSSQNIIPTNNTLSPPPPASTTSSTSKKARSTSKTSTPLQAAVTQPSVSTTVPPVTVSISATPVPSQTPPAPPPSSSIIPTSTTPLPAPAVTVQSLTTSYVPASVQKSSTCDWGCYGWNCTLPSTPCNGLWQCVNGYCKSSITATSVATSDSGWHGGNIGDACGGDDYCSDPWPCIGGYCASSRAS